MIVGVCGYGYSGSGAVMDFLRGFDCFSCPIPDKEFDIAYIPHGIQDLEYQLMERRTRYLSSYIAIRDFMLLTQRMSSSRSIYRKQTGNGFVLRSHKLLEDLIQISWPGQLGMNKYFAGSNKLLALSQSVDWKTKRLFEIITNRRYPLSNRNRMYLSIRPENFYKEVESYIKDVLEMLGFDFGKIILLNQPFDVFDPKRSMKFFEKSKAILVDRDPRDLYILAKCYLKIQGSCIPTDNVQKFVEYWRLIREGCTDDDSNILHISFEDLIFNYEVTSAKIKHFLGIEYACNINFFFDPDVSINNTRLFLNHSGLREDIEYICKELPQYLYPFEKCNRIPTRKKKPF